MIIKEEKKMKKGYYIHFEARATAGVSKKIDMQITELSKYFTIDEINIRSRKVSIIKRLRRLLPGGAVDRTYDDAIREMSNPDFVYIRRTTADKNYLKFLAEIKRRWRTCKIIVEIFTYPYDRDEFMRWTTWPYYFKEKYQRKRLSQYIDRYVTFSEDKIIFDTPTIQTGNGVFVDDIKIPNNIGQDNNAVNLIGVAYMQKHHGYERVIKGLYAYYKEGNTRKVICHLVGDGPEKRRYQKLVKKYGLTENVIFYPTLIGEDLDRVYEQGDVAISALGVYKDGINRENSLKTREYMAKGFPMVVGCKVDGIDETFPFVCQFPNNSSPIDIKNLLAFYDDLCQKYTKKEMQNMIRDYVKRVADMPIVMKPIIDYISI